MSSVKTLHSAAMEYYDLGKIAKAKGHQDTYDDYVQKAYAIAMEAALRSQIEFAEGDPLKAIYLRSVSWLAYDVGHFEEARLWAAIALQIAPNDYEKASLEGLLKKVKNKIKTTTAKSSLLGVLISIDVEQNKIFIRYHENAPSQMISLPNSFFQKIIPFFVGQVVEVDYALAGDGVDFVLRDIRLAA